MDAAWRRASWTFLGLVVATGLFGILALRIPLIGPRSFVIYLFVIPFAAAVMAGQHYRHHGAPALAVALGAVSGLGAQAALFGFPLLAYGLKEGFEGVDRSALTLMMVAVPLAMGAVAGLGAAVLVHGVKRYRARHGLVHAPH